MSLIYVGIDEAGYGPMLGPLCVGLSAFRIAEWDVSAGAPDMWDSLAPVIQRHLKGASGRGRGAGRRVGAGGIAIADSKVLKLSNQGKRHPLLHLERGVLAMLGCCGECPCDEARLLSYVNAEVEERPWYRDDASKLPVAHAAESIAIDTNRLRTALAAAGVDVIELRCDVVGERAFNDCVRTTGSKAQSTLQAIGRLVGHVLESSTDDASDMRIVCDRLGGRARYQRSLSEVLPGVEVGEIGWSDTKSAYSLQCPGTGREAIMHLETEAEQKHMPVALASMLAKYVRELLMARLNRYWCDRLVDLKPTAGYVTDARRWLADVGPSMTEEEREAMVRIA